MNAHNAEERENLTLPAEEYFKLLLETLDGDKEKRVAFCPGGTSMKPTLRDRKDVVYLGLCDKIEKYDIALYRAANGKYNLHRVVAVLKNGDAIFRGDAFVNPEPPVNKEDIYAKVYAIERGKLRIDCERSRAYKLYSRILYAQRETRRMIKRTLKFFRRKLGAIKRSVFGKKESIPRVKR